MDAGNAGNTGSAVREAEGLLRQGRPADAERALRAVLATAPDHVDARYALAVAERHQHRWRRALGTLSGILRTRPGFGRAHQEAGYNHIAQRAFGEAAAAFERAVAANPSLVNSWKCLRKLYAEQRIGTPADRARADRQVAFLTELPAPLIGAMGHYHEDRLAEADALCRRFLRDNKTHAEGMRLLAEIDTRNKMFDEAEFLLESCLEFAPDNDNARIQYAQLLLRTQKFGKALRQAERLRGSHPDDPVVLGLLAAASAGVGDTTDAIAGYQRLMAEHPDNHLFPVALAHVHKAAGNRAEAIALYRKAYAIKPDHGDAFWSLANTKSHAFTDAEIAQMTTVEAADATSDEDRAQICFALGSAFEARREHQRAFHYYAKGNARKKATSQHSPEHLQVRIDSQIATCTQALFEARAGVGCERPDPIFIVGLPRAGSTLIEQILASHPLVDGTMELHNILNLAKRLRGRDENPQAPRYPHILAELDESYFRRFGEQFINDTRPYRGDAPFFIDKMPNNFFHIGLIRLILPNAKVIDACRGPMACCFSGFKQLFGEGQEFSYDLTTIGNYYRQYVKLMAHWDAVLPGFVLRVRHEDVVADLEGQVRRLLDFCGLPFDQACVDFHQSGRSVYTPSAEQVRQPINSAGLDQWRHFAEWLAPLRQALGPELADQ